MTADRKTAQKKCSGSLGHPWFSGLSDRVSPVCAQWSRQQPLSGFRPEVEPVSTTPVVTATNRPTEHENLLSFYILLNPRLRTLSKILLRDATKVFNDIAYNRFAMSFYHSVES